MSLYAIDIQLTIKGAIHMMVEARSDEEARELATRHVSKLDEVHRLDREADILKCKKLDSA